MEIYAITDDRGVVRYVGQSWNAAKRQRGHWGSRFKMELPLARWLRTLEKPPSWRILVIVADADANRTEREIIIAARAAFPGDNLNVRTRGGWGPELRARLSDARMGHVVPPATRAKIGEANRGRKHAPEVSAKASERAKAQWADPEYREKRLAAFRSEESRARRADAHTGQSHSVETRQRLSESKAAQWTDPEYRSKTTEAHMGHSPSDAAKAKLSAASKARWADPEWRAKMIAAQRAAGRGKHA